MPGLILTNKITDLHCLTSKIKYEQCLKHYDGDDSQNSCQHLKAIWEECLKDVNQARIFNHRKLRCKTSCDSGRQDYNNTIYTQ